MSRMFELSDRAVDQIAADDPSLAVVLAIPGIEPGLTDFSPGGIDARAELTRGLLAEVETTPAENDADRRAAGVMRHHLQHAAAADEAGDPLRDINILSSPPQQIRMALEFAPADATGELVDQVPSALAGWRTALGEGAARGLPASRRQALRVAEQLAVYGDSWISSFAEERGCSDTTRAAAAAGFRDTAVWLTDVYAQQADPTDAVGEERYLRAAAAYNGIELDLDDTFAWGWHEVDRLSRAMRAEVDELYPGLPMTEVRARLDADPAYQIQGIPALVDHLTSLTQTATERVDGELFDIDPRVRECGVEIAAAGSAAAPYYVQPSEDLSRPGTTWYPANGDTVFPRWWLETVWFHEGVPGHHLQLGAIAVHDDVSRFQRVLGTTSGHAEGWALYAENLADELGWFADPGTRIGYLSAQLMRAVRVVVDIGLHTDRRVPAGFRGERRSITPDLALTMLTDLALLPEPFARSEVDRYLGMPGQAISYKVGERVWTQLRDDARAAAGASFDLKSWHAQAFDLGPMGLAQFTEEMRAVSPDPH